MRLWRCRTSTYPQSDVQYVYEYPFRRLDREADMREVSVRFEGMVGSDEEQPIGVKK